MSTENTQTDVAVFIDFENVYVSVREKLDASPNFELIMDRCNDLGRVVIARAYADWYRYPRITSALYANGIEPMYVPTYYYDKEMGRTGRAIKNSVDMNLCIDAMKTLFLNTNIQKFVLATGDRDFIPLVNSIRQQGKEVIVIGIGGAASTHLAQSADEFVFYEQLIGHAQTIHSEPIPDGPSGKSRRHESVTSTPGVMPKPEPVQSNQDIYDTLVKAIHVVRERGYLSTLGSLKLVMKELMGGEFKESHYKDINGRSFTKFKDFVIDAEKRGKVQLYTSGTVSEVFLPGEDARKLSQFADIKEDTPTDQNVIALSQNQKEQPQSLNASSSSLSSSGKTRRRRRPRNQRQETIHPLLTVLKKGLVDELDDELETDEEGEETFHHSVYDQSLTMDDDGEETQEFEVEDDALIHNQLTYEALRDKIQFGSEWEAFEQSHMQPGAFSKDTDIERDAFSEMQAKNPDDYLVNKQLPILENESSMLFNVGEALTLSHMTDILPGQKAYVWDEPTFSDEPDCATTDDDEPSDYADTDDLDSLDETDDSEASELDDMDDDLDDDGKTIEFSEQEWQAFRVMMQNFTKPVSFANVFDSLREIRKQQLIVRTNEQLRNFVKQAINQGLLERSGRGKRVYYTLKEQSGHVANTDTTDAPDNEE